jgi:hypothetical protein
VLSLRRGGIEDVDAVPHCGPHVPGDSAERSRRVMGIVSRIEEMIQESEQCSSRQTFGSVTDWRITTVLCATDE